MKLEVVGKMRLTCLFLLASMLLFAGCDSSRSQDKSSGDIGPTPTEQVKAKLLKQIARKYENPQAHYELGQLYQSEGLWVEAEYEYNTTLRFAPAHRPAQAALVKMLLTSGDTAKSQLTADIYINQTSSSAEESLKLALAFQKESLDEYALRCYQKALSLQPNSAKVHRQVGYYYLSKSNEAQARDYLSRSFQLNPNQPEVAGALGRLGVVVRIPRTTQDSPKKLDKIVNESDKQLAP